MLDPAPQAVTPKFTGTAALLLVALMLHRKTTEAHSPRQQLFTLVLLVLDALLIGLIWTVR